MYGSFGQPLANHFMQRDQMRNQANIAAMKYGNKGGGGNDDYAKMYSLGLETAKVQEQLAQIQEARNKEAMDNLENLLGELSIAKANNDTKRMNYTWSKLMRDPEFAKGVRETAGPVIDNGVPYNPGDTNVNIEVGSMGFNYFNQLGYVKSNEQAAMEQQQAEFAKNMTPATVEDGRAQMAAPTDNFNMTNYGSGSNPSDSNKNNLRDAFKPGALPRTKKIKSPLTNGNEAVMNHPDDEAGSLNQATNSIESDESEWQNSEEYRQLRDAEREHNKDFKPGERQISEDDLRNALETGDFSKIPPEYHDEMKAWLAGIKISANPDGSYAIYSQLDVTNMLTQQQQRQLAAQQRAEDNLDGLFNSALGQKARMEENTRQNTLQAQGNANKVLQLQQQYLDKNPNLGSLQSFNNLNVNNYDPKTGTLTGGSHQQPQILGGGGGNSSTSNDKINPHAVGTEALKKTLQATNGILGNTSIPPEKADFNSVLNLLLANNDMKGVRQLINAVGNEQMINPKTGKMERIRDIFANESKGVDKKSSGLFATLQNAQQEALSKVGTDNNVLLAAFDNLVSYMPGDLFGGATDSAKVAAMRIAMANNSKMEMRANGMIYTGTKDDIKNMGSRNMAYMFEINRANAARTINSIDQAIAGSADMFEKIGLAEQRERLTNFVNYTQVMFDVANILGSKLKDYIPNTGYQANTDTDDNIHIPLQHPKYSAIIKTADNNYMLQDNNGTMFTVPLKDIHKYIK